MTNLERKIQNGQAYLKQLMEKQPHRVMVGSNGMLALQPQVKGKGSNRKRSKKSRHRSLASKKARLNTVKPLACQNCGDMRSDLHAHHVIPYAQLKWEGREHDVDAHVFKWICEECHIKEHENEPVSRLMKKRRDEAR